MTTIRATIIQEQCPEDPRKEWDNLGTMACWHDRYTLGDVQPSESPEEWLEENAPEGSIVLPLYLYDHSGITMSTSPFSCPWDSGQVGVIVLTPEELRAEYGDTSDESREKAIACLVAGVKIYDHYLTGNVWGFLIESVEPCACCGTEQSEHVDSCYGFFGDDLEYTGILDHVDPEYQDAIRAAWENRF